MLSHRKHPFTPELLLQVFPLFQLDKPLHAAMWALFLVTFFTFLWKCYLVPDVANRISPKVPLRADLVFDSHDATLNIVASKTIQYEQRSLSIPLPHIPGSPLCPVTALRHYLRLNSGPFTAPLFSVVCSTLQQLFPLTYRHFYVFISKVISAIGLVLAHYSPHSFRRGGASFAFRCNVPSELIQRQGDWQSDAYLIYISKCHLLESDAPSIRWLLISSAPVISSLIWCTILFSFFYIPHNSHPLFMSHNFGLGVFLAGVYWFSYNLFRYQCIVQLSNLTQ